MITKCSYLHFYENNKYLYLEDKTASYFSPTHCSVETYECEDSVGVVSTKMECWYLSNLYGFLKIDFLFDKFYGRINQHFIINWCFLQSIVLQRIFLLWNHWNRVTIENFPFTHKSVCLTTNLIYRRWTV